MGFCGTKSRKGFVDLCEISECSREMACFLILAQEAELGKELEEGKSE